MAVLVPHIGERHAHQPGLDARIRLHVDVAKVRLVEDRRRHIVTGYGEVNVGASGRGDGGDEDDPAW